MKNFNVLHRTPLKNVNIAGLIPVMQYSYDGTTKDFNIHQSLRLPSGETVALLILSLNAPFATNTTMREKYKLANNICLQSQNIFHCYIDEIADGTVIKPWLTELTEAEFYLSID